MSKTTATSFIKLQTGISLNFDTLSAGERRAEKYVEKLKGIGSQNPTIDELKELNII